MGVKTVTLGGLTVEVWYPGVPGSEAGVDARRYDIRGSLPDSEQAKVPDAKTPWQDCDCYPDVPVDGAHGPYPAVIFVHGTAGFRSQSLEHVDALGQPRLRGAGGRPPRPVAQGPARAAVRVSQQSRST